MGSRRDAATAAAAVICLALVAVASPAAIVQDSWLTLVAGRLVATAGIPHRELLTVWAHGRTWIDQQWLAQLAFYRVYGLGGIRAVVATSGLLAGAAWVGAIVLARRRGASGWALCVWAPATVLAAPWAWQARAQSFALPLFVCLLALVFADARRRSPRVFAALPLLALWGNLHGTAVLGACILALHGVALAVRDAVARAPLARSALRAAALAGGGFLALAANPYGLGIVSYYRTMLLDPPFASLVAEWMPPAPSLLTAPFYALAVVAGVLALRRARRLAPTEVAVGIALLVAAATAIRSITWFALAALVLVPPLWPELRLPGRLLVAPARRAVLLGAPLALAGALAAFPGSVAARQAESWSTRGAAALEAAAERHPDVRVLADDRHADFLLWREPELAGRLLDDARLELLTRAQVERLARFEQSSGRQAAAGAGLVVLDPHTQALAPWRTAGWRLLYADGSIGVLERRPSSLASSPGRRGSVARHSSSVRSLPARRSAATHSV